MKNQQKIKAALVLSGGGALGAAHIGAVEKLEKHGFEFDFFAGVSAGAIVAAFIACEKKAAEALAIIKEINVFSLAFDFSKSNFGILRGNKIKKILDKIFEDKDFKDLKSPLLIGATDFTTGERIIINQGKISDAVRASLSVPLLFEPFYHEKTKRWLADGGLSQNFPLDLAIEKYKGDKIIGIDVAGNFPKNVDFLEKKFFGKAKKLRMMAQRTMRIIFKNQQANFPQDKRVTIIRPDLNKFTSFDAFKLEDIVEQGRKINLK